MTRASPGTGIVGSYRVRATLRVAARKPPVRPPRSGAPSGPRSGPRVRLPIDRRQPFGRHVGVDLGGRQARVAEQFLDAAQVGAALEQVGRRRVAQPVRAEFGRPGRPLRSRRCTTDRTARGSIRPPRRPRNSAAPDRGPASAGSTCCPARPPAPGRRAGRTAQCVPWRPCRTPAAPDGAVDVGQVQSGQLGHPDPGGVEQLEHRPVAQSDGPLAPLVVRADRSRTSTATSTGTSSRAAAWSLRSTDGRCRSGRATASRRPGSVSSNPVRCAHPVNERAAAERRASDERAAPVLRNRASQLRSTARSRSAGLEPPILRQMVEQRHHVRRVGPGGGGRDVPFVLQMTQIVAVRPAQIVGQAGEPGRGTRGRRVAVTGRPSRRAATRVKAPLRTSRGPHRALLRSARCARCSSADRRRP